MVTPKSAHLLDGPAARRRRHQHHQQEYAAAACVLHARPAALFSVTSDPQTFKFVWVGLQPAAAMVLRLRLTAGPGPLYIVLQGAATCCWIQCDQSFAENYLHTCPVMYFHYFFTDFISCSCSCDASMAPALHQEDNSSTASVRHITFESPPLACFVQILPEWPFHAATPSPQHTGILTETSLLPS